MMNKIITSAITAISVAAGADFSSIAGEMQREQVWHAGEGGVNAEKVTIQYFMPENKNGTALLICPGGGYGCLCDSYEGTDIAKWLTRYGITCIVLRYRVGSELKTCPLNDAAQAMCIIRKNAAKYGIAPDRIGVIGFSAGGHLASSLATHYKDFPGSRPDFQILIYPVITMLDNTHAGSRNNFLGTNASEQDKIRFSNEKQVSSTDCMAFVCHAVTDQVVPVINSRNYVEALKQHNIPVEYLELPSGAHGLGCGHSPEWEAWQTACLAWLQKNKLADIHSK